MKKFGWFKFGECLVIRQVRQTFPLYGIGGGSDCIIMIVSQFTIPALLIQWECLVGVAGSALIEACHHWQTINVAGRIIVVCNNQDNSKKNLSLNVMLLCLNCCRLERRFAACMQIIGK